jgi:hypothetical protein
VRVTPATPPPSHRERIFPQGALSIISSMPGRRGGRRGSAAPLRLSCAIGLGLRFGGLRVRRNPNASCGRDARVGIGAEMLAGRSPIRCRRAVSQRFSMMRAPAKCPTFFTICEASSGRG